MSVRSAGVRLGSRFWMPIRWGVLSIESATAPQQSAPPCLSEVLHYCVGACCRHATIFSRLGRDRVDGRCLGTEHDFSHAIFDRRETRFRGRNQGDRTEEAGHFSLSRLMTGLLFAQGRRTVASWLRPAQFGDDYRAYYLRGTRYQMGRDDAVSAGRNGPRTGGLLAHNPFRGTTPGRPPVGNGHAVGIALAAGQGRFSNSGVVKQRQLRFGRVFGGRNHGCQNLFLGRAVLKGVDEAFGSRAVSLTMQEIVIKPLHRSLSCFGTLEDDIHDFVATGTVGQRLGERSLPGGVDVSVQNISVEGFEITEIRAATLALKILQGTGNRGSHLSKTAAVLEKSHCGVESSRIRGAMEQ
jgi:hypothetical protein